MFVLMTVSTGNMTCKSPSLCTFQRAKYMSKAKYPLSKLLFHTKGYIRLYKHDHRDCLYMKQLP